MPNPLVECIPNFSDARRPEVIEAILQAITEVSDPEINKAVANHFKNLHAFLAREITRAQDERKVMKVFSAELIAWTMIHVGLGYGVLVALGVPGQGEDAKGDHVQTMLERLIVGRHED